MPRVQLLNKRDLTLNSQTRSCFAFKDSLRLSIQLEQKKRCLKKILGTLLLKKEKEEEFNLWNVIWVYLLGQMGRGSMKFSWCSVNPVHFKVKYKANWCIFLYSHYFYIRVDSCLCYMIWKILKSLLSSNISSFNQIYNLKFHSGKSVFGLR